MNVNKTLEKVLEEAAVCGELKLVGRRLKDFPKMAYKFNLTDTVFADLSKNRFTELPEDIAAFPFLEKLLIYHNVIKYIPESVSSMHSLQYLDLRNNQLQALPKELCFLPLKILLVSNNRLNALPEEIGRLGETLTELDAAHNHITILPVRMGDLKQLRNLNLCSNQLVYLPRDLCSLKLTHLDISSNRISSLPPELRQMISLIQLDVSNNPVTSPPASLCTHGLVHIFKYLEMVGTRDEKDGVILRGKAITPKTAQQHAATIPLDRDKKRQPMISLSEIRGEATGVGMQVIHNIARETNFKDLKKQENNNKQEISLPNSPDKGNLSQIQTYKEYKEALKQQRQDVYRRELVSPTNGASTLTGNGSSTPNALSPKTNNGYVNGNNVENGNDTPYIKPTGPLKSNNISNTSNVTLTTKKLTKTVSWNRDIPASDTKNFTMRREYDKQKEETELIMQLRQIIKSRLKISLPDDLASALQDGVVLCHLANYVRPQSVASIHVPSATTPKLTVTRCRRNVDNFLYACRKTGVDEKLICCAADILEGKGVVQTAITVVELLKFHCGTGLKSPINRTKSVEDV